MKAVGDQNRNSVVDSQPPYEKNAPVVVSKFEEDARYLNTLTQKTTMKHLRKHNFQVKRKVQNNNDDLE